MGIPVYAIDEFPNDDLLWRIEWIGGVGYNTSVPSDPLMDVCMAQLPAVETNPLSARSRSSQTKRTVRIGVGLLNRGANEEPLTRATFVTPETGSGANLKS
jgi:hypothetical protein